MAQHSLSIIIPAYNEEQTIRKLLDKVCAVTLIEGISKEILVIDDGSSDSTNDIVAEYISSLGVKNIRLISQERNQGKGAALRKGIEVATGDFIIIQDADLEYDPEDYNLLLPHLLNGEKVVYGSRFLRKENKHSYQSFYYGGLLVTFFTNLLFLQKLTDEPTCYKAFETNFLKSIPLKCTGFEFCPEVTAKTAKKGIKIKEVPIHYYPRSIEQGKKIKWTDGLDALWTLLKYRIID